MSPSSTSSNGGSSRYQIRNRPGSLRRKLLRSHMIVACGGLALLIVALISTLWTRSHTLRLIDITEPTARASAAALTGVTRSLADLRGWMVLGDERLKRKRHRAWTDEISPELERLKTFSPQWSATDIQSLDRLVQVLEDLEEAQWWIEEIAQTPGNDPLRIDYEREIEPLADNILRATTALIELEKSVSEAPGRKRLLGLMADFHRMFASAHGHLGKFVVQGRQVFETEFRTSVKEAVEKLTAIRQQGDLLGDTPEINEILAPLASEVVVYESLATGLFEFESSTDSRNVARFLLGDDARPLAEEATKILEALGTSQTSRMKADASDVAVIGETAVGILVVFILGMAMVAWVLSSRSADEITEPIEALSLATEKLASGELAENIPVPPDNELGQLTRSFNTMRTSLEENQLALREEVARTGAILETAADGIIVIDSEGLVRSFNPASERLFGYRAGEVLRKNVKRLMPEPYRAEHDGYIENYLLTGKNRVIGMGREIVGQRKDGSTFPMWLSVGEMAPGDRKMFVGIVHDMSSEKAQEEELRQARDASEAANLAKSEFLANMSHEIRTPMNGVIGMTDLLLGTKLTAEQEEYLQVVKQSADSLLLLLNDILDFSKIEVGKVELESREFSLRDTLGDALHTVSFRAFEKGLELAERIAPEVPDSLRGDATRLRQILVNLVGNAIKFTEWGEIMIEVDLDRHSSKKGRPCLHFSVRDTGIGISPEKLAVIFEAFSQADSSMSRRYGGTGLGLAISLELVRLMDGRMWVESELRQGSTFHFTASFDLGARQDPSVEAVDLEGLPVLVVDDNSTNRRILEEILVEWKMLPVLVDRGTSALVELRRATKADEPYPILIADAMMPEMDGFTLSRTLREDPGIAQPAIIMLSSSGERHLNIPEEQALGISDYLIKPAKHSDLLLAMRQALGLSPLRSVGKSRRPAASPAKTEQLTPLRILVVEDHELNRLLVVRILEKHGHTVRTATNGQEALEFLQDDSFDIILMDVQMPIMDGFQTTLRIRERELESGSRIPIVAMTAHAGESDRKACFEVGMDAYVAKPIRSKTLFDAMSSALAGDPVAPAQRVEREKSVDSVLDREELMRRVEDDTALLREMVRIFLEETPTILERTKKSMVEGDADTLMRSAHKLKGALGSLSAKRATDLARRLEEMGREDDLDQSREIFTRLEEEYRLLEEALRTLDAGHRQ